MKYLGLYSGFFSTFDDHDILEKNNVDPGLS